MYFWISRCLCRTSTLALSKTLSAYWVFWASEKVTLLISLDVQQTPALKHSPSALLFSAHTHVATTLFKTPPAHCCAVIFRSLAGSLRGFLQLMVTKATQLHTQRGTNISIPMRSSAFNMSVIIWNQISQQHHIKQSSALWSQIRASEFSLRKQQTLLSSNSHVWSVLLIPAQLWPSHLFYLNTDQKLLGMGRRTVHTIKGNAWSIFSGGSNLLPEMCTLSILNPCKERHECLQWSFEWWYFQFKQGQQHLSSGQPMSLCSKSHFICRWSCTASVINITQQDQPEKVTSHQIIF